MGTAHVCALGLESFLTVVSERVHQAMKRAIGTATYDVTGVGTIWYLESFKTNVTLYKVRYALNVAKRNATCE